MSGAEILQIFASAVAIADLARRTVRFLKNVPHADDHVRELREKIGQLRQIVKTVQELVNHRQDMQRSEGVSSFEQTIWKHLERSLRASKRLLEKFENTVKSKERPNSGWIRRGIIELQLGLDQNEIAKFEQSLDAHIQAIQLWITSLQV